MATMDAMVVSRGASKPARGGLRSRSRRMGIAALMVALLLALALAARPTAAAQSVDLEGFEGTDGEATIEFAADLDDEIDFVAPEAEEPAEKVRTTSRPPQRPSICQPSSH